MNSTIISYLSQFDWYNVLVKVGSGVVGESSPNLMAFLVFGFAATVIMVVAMTIGGLATYAERKISADIQHRMGPNRVGPYGLLQFMADGVKMIMKEDIIPKNADRFLFMLAPFLCMLGVFSTLAVLPFSSGLTLSHLDVGVFYLVAISSLVGLGVFIGGYSSNSKWSMLGGMRGASQIISYEIPAIITILSIVLLAGSLSFSGIVENQSGLPNGWFVLHNPFTFIGFFVFCISALAESNRAPFDLPEAESELVSGYHTEFSGMKFAFFALAEFVEVFVLCAVCAALFLGGYKVPFNLGQGHFVGQLLELGAFFTKTFILYYIVIWIRWTFPRLRVDQLMTLCWKYLTPIAMFNLIGTAVWVYLFNGKSIFELLFSASHTLPTH